MTLHTLLNFLNPQAISHITRWEDLNLIPIGSEWSVREQIYFLERVKIWTSGDFCFLDLEEWRIESHMVSKHLRCLGKTQELLETEVQIGLPPIWSRVVSSPKSWSTLKADNLRVLRGQTASQLATALLEVGENWNGKPLAVPTARDEGNTPYVRLNVESLLDNIRECVGNGAFLEETGEGTFAKQVTRINESNGTPSIVSKYYDSHNHATAEPVEIFNQAILPNRPACEIPLSTAKAMIGEQFLWSEWSRRGKPEDLENPNLHYCIHNNGSYDKIFSYLSKGVPQAEAQRISDLAASSEITAALSLSSIPEVNKKLSAHLLTKPTPKGALQILAHGGLLPKVCLKNSWILGWAQSSRKNQRKQIAA